MAEASTVPTTRSSVGTDSCVALATDTGTMGMAIGPLAGCAVLQALRKSRHCADSTIVVIRFTAGTMGYSQEPDIAVAIDGVIDLKIAALDSHVSQFYEWLPWVAGTLADVPKDPAERKAWLKRSRTREASPAVRASLVKWYGAEKGNAARYYEAFEICEYGTQPNEARIRQLFPMLK